MTHIYFYSHGKKYKELSNFWHAPFSVNNVEYPTAEHYFQSQKTIDPIMQKQIREAPSPSLAKKIGKRVELRPDWEDVKDDVMLTAIRAIFFQNEKLARILLDTGDARLHEDSPHDVYWGRKGKDLLGRLLEQLREELHKSRKDNT